MNSRLLCCTLLSSALLAPPAAAAPAAPADKRAGGGIEFLLGQEQWQAGQRYRAGDDWLALNCERNECSLVPARLAVHKKPWQGHYDDRPTEGQALTFSKLKPGPGQVIAWFRLDRSKPWLLPGPVSTYANATQRMKRPTSEGTLELAVDLPGGSEARFVPLLDREAKRFLLQLRLPGKRQMLGELASCSHELNTNYLIWAGDLDRDGQPDYLVSFIDAEGQALLYLGGQAGRGEIAGVAGSYSAPPFGGECDGTGWLE